MIIGWFYMIIRSHRLMTILGIILVLGGIVTVGIGITGPLVINQMLEDGLKDTLVLTVEDWDSPWLFDSNLNVIEQGDSWLYTGPENIKVPPVYDSFYIYNITNYNVTSNSFTGNVPIYEEVGPFICQKIDNRTVLGHTEDTVTYQEFSWYLVADSGHQEELTLDDVIISWNPLYRAYCLGAGNEANLHYGLAQNLINSTVHALADALENFTQAEEQWGNLTYSSPFGLEAANFETNLNLTGNQVDNFLYNPNKNYAIAENVTSLAVFRQTYSEMNETYATRYEITTNQVLLLGSFLEALVPFWMWESGVSYVAKRTFGDWFFTFQDPVAGACTALVGNGTYSPIKRINTGAKNLDKIWQQEAHNDIEKFEVAKNCFWHENESVCGTTGDGFAPGIEKNDKLTIWGGTDTYRSSELVYSGKGYIQEIETMKFSLSSSAWKVDPKYDQYIEGFMNLTAWNFGVPILLSPLHYQEYPDVDSVLEKDNTVLYIEPNTGFPLKGLKRMQFNLQLFNYSLYNTKIMGNYSYHSSTTGTVFIEPFGYAERLGSVENLSSKEFNKLKDGLDQLKLAQNLASLLSTGGLGIGLALIAVGTVLTFVPRYLRRKFIDN